MPSTAAEAAEVFEADLLRLLQSVRDIDAADFSDVLTQAHDNIDEVLIAFIDCLQDKDKGDEADALDNVRDKLGGFGFKESKPPSPQIYDKIVGAAENELEKL